MRILFLDQTFLLMTNQNPPFAFFKSSDRVRSINTPDVANADIDILVREWPRMKNLKQGKYQAIQPSKLTIKYNYHRTKLIDYYQVKAIKK